MKNIRIAMLAPIAWRTPPRHYGPWEQVVSWLTEGLVNLGVDVTLFATKDSITKAKLRAVAATPYEESDIHPKVWECLHISEVFEHAADFDIIHNHFDYLPLTYSQLVSTPVVTTIHGFSSPKIVPVYQKYDGKVAYVSISDSDRHPSLTYAATVHHGLDESLFPFQATATGYLLFFGRISPEKGTAEAIAIAQATGRRLVIAGIIQHQDYFDREVTPHLAPGKVEYIGNVGPDERPRVLGGAAALLHPIAFNEPFGLSIIEAMACGTPVIAFNRGSMPELIKDGKTGFLVQNIEQAVSAVGRLRELDRAACREHVEQHFTRERMAAGYQAVYERILNSR
jgi:glycosyltransferase involved in cell wall biosynthesis